MKIYWALYPIALLYGCAVRLRNKCFDWGILHEQRFATPVICIGNLTVGGTGKTPHCEYLIRLLSSQGKVAVLSRGYKRKSKGFVLADSQTAMSQIGDEPYQMKQKFPETIVAVDANRREGIQHLEKLHPDVILLDDAYQHRYVKAGLNLLLTDFNRLMTRDQMLPAGRLREPLAGKNRADIILVTKCPSSITPEQREEIRKEIQPANHQTVYFSTFVYENLQRVFEEAASLSLNQISKKDSVLLLTGIANPEPLTKEIRQYTANITSLSYPDHHNFTVEDMKQIVQAYQLQAAKGKCWVITTEKDATRLTSLNGWDDELKKAMWKLPIKVRILEGKEKEFNDSICKELK